jgi:hypothetical protein
MLSENIRDNFMKSCKCSSTEFVTNPNSYGVFELVNGKLEFIRTESSEDEIHVFCSKCYKEVVKFEING